MTIIFHQNMLTFGGAAAARNVAYGAAFTAGFPAGPVDVAGFTEIVNNGATHATLTALCVNLGITFIGNFSCGITALASGPEYIGIGVRTAVGGAVVRAVGRFGFNKQNGGLTLIHEIQPYPVPLNWGVDPISEYCLPDFRGAVYVIISLGGFLSAIGFLHNRYKDPLDPLWGAAGPPDNAHRTLIADKIPDMMLDMNNSLDDFSHTLGLPRLPNGGVYLGGDFNVPPRVWQSPRKAMWQPHSEVLMARPATFQRPPPPPPVNPANFNNGGTTAAANLYDYWYVFSPPPPAAPPLPPPAPAITAWVVPDTLGWDLVGGHMSDHCGIIVQV